ncbi:MAG: DHH family phosphoesterase [Leptospiraceae bacterium]|nr:DHH family phosphoesterase [Leptospiraceae bacterium]MCZ8348161.1 DHH family phosphoesterase [Leptospiraceae bacterium]
MSIQPEHGYLLQNFTLGTEIREFLIQKRTKGLDPHEINSFQFFKKGISNAIFFHSPFLLPDIIPSIKQLLASIENEEKILLYGDRDTDGVSSTAILYHFLKKEFPSIQLEATTSSKNEAYGLCPEAILKIKKFKPKLLITLDFGTSNANEINDLAKQGIKSIVIDHHEIPSQTIDSCLLNPKRIDSIYPEKKICTSFLAWKLSLAILYYKSLEYNKIYKISTTKEIQYFQNGIRIENPNENEAEIFEFNKEAKIQEEYTSLNASIPDELYIFYEQLKKIPDLFRKLTPLSSLAGIGTITDMMPLVGENRAMVRLACDYLSELSSNLNTPSLPGIKMILTHTGLLGKKVSSKDLGWGIGPLLNSAGRMGQTEIAFDLLLADSDQAAESKIKELIKTNEERKERTKRNVYKTEKFFQRNAHLTEKPILFCYEPDLEPGVSGIVATKLVETFQKPAIFITPDHGQARGSIRSCGSENVLDLLKEAQDILNQYGGHPEAGGFSVEIHRIPELQEKIYSLSVEWLKNFDTPVQKIISDLKTRAQDLDKNLFNVLEYLEPTGHGNPPILLSIEKAKVLNFTFMGNGKHARFKLLGAGNLKFIIWNEAERMSRIVSLQESIDLWGNLELSSFLGKTSLQFLVTHYS